LGAFFETLNVGVNFVKSFLSLVLVIFITACASGVKLNDVPVEDKSGAKPSSDLTSIKSAPTQSETQPQSKVEPVTPSTNENYASGPANTGKIVYFDYDSFSVKPEFQSVIESHAQFLKANPRARLSLEGHTDERGGREYNLALGQKRADAVRQSLSLLGVGSGQIETVSFGEEKSAVQGNSETAFSKNRRAEFFYK
jgi:peptidoglycan-associated lipoprotein